MFQLGDMIEHDEQGFGIVISIWNNLDKEWFTVEYFNSHIHSFPNKPFFLTLKKVS